MQTEQTQEIAKASIKSENDAILAVIERVALNPNADIEKLERMLDMQERILNRNAKSQFAADFVRLKPHLPKIIRSKDNTQTKSKYAPLEDINMKIDPVLAQYGFGTATKIIAQTTDSISVKAELWHSSGHVEETIITMPLDRTGIAGTVNKTLPHATSSSATYAKRVAICALLNISTGDDKDGNGEIEFLEHEKAVEIDLLVNEVKADKAKFLEYMGVDSIQHIRANEYKKAKFMLEAKKKRKEKENAAA